MPITIPASYLAYCTNCVVRGAVDHILKFKNPRTPANLEWDELKKFHEMVLSAHQVRCEFAIFLHDLWNAVWKPAVEKRNFTPKTITDTYRVWQQDDDILNAHTIWDGKWFGRAYDIDGAEFVFDLGTFADTDTKRVQLTLCLWNSDGEIYTNDSEFVLGNRWPHEDIDDDSYAYSSKKLAPIVDGGNIDLGPLRKAAADALTAVERFCQSD